MAKMKKQPEPEKKLEPQRIVHESEPVSPAPVMEAPAGEPCPDAAATEAPLADRSLFK